MLNKGAISNKNIIIKAQKEEKNKVTGLENEIHIDTNELIKDNKIYVELFNNHWTNIVQETSGLAPNRIGSPKNSNLDKWTVFDINIKTIQV